MSTRQHLLDAVIRQLNTSMQAQDLVRQLDDLIDSLFKFRESIDDKFERCISVNYQSLVRQWCQEAGLDLEDRVGVQKQLTLLRKELLAIPVLHITIAYEPKGFQMKPLNEWLSKNFDRKVLLDITVDHTIIGGALIQSGGYYKDYSVRKSLLDQYASGALRLKSFT